MPSTRIPGPLGLYGPFAKLFQTANSTPSLGTGNGGAGYGEYCSADPFAIDQGTLARNQTPLTGPVGTTSGGPASTAQASAVEKSVILAAPLQLDKEKFYELYSKESAPFGVLNAERRAGLNEVLGMIQADANLLNVHWIAYMLATLMHECRSAASKWKLTWKPVSETGGDKMAYGKEVVVTNWEGQPLGTDGLALTPEAKPDPKTSEKVGKLFYSKAALIRRRYYGRGYVQITHMDNYRSMDDALGLKKTLLLDPEKALDPAIAYNIMSYGMREGSFRGKRQRTGAKGFFGGHKLSDYLGTSSGYKQARNIINGDVAEHGDTIAGYAGTFEKIIQASRTV